jgi:hypothetical protein
MANAAAFIRTVAIVAGLLIGLVPDGVLEQSPSESPNLQPTRRVRDVAFGQTVVSSTNSVTGVIVTATAAAPLVVTVGVTAAASQPSALGPLVTARGVACIDVNHDAQCQAKEPRVVDVILRGSNGASAVTDMAGQYAIQAPASSELDVSIPSGYKSINGNLRRLRMQMFVADAIDIPLIVDAAVAQNGATETGALGALSFPVLALSVALLLMLILVVIALLGLRRLSEKLLRQQSMLLRDQRARDLDALLQAPQGWQAIAAQIVADAIGESVAIDGDRGILDVTADPEPRFSLVTRDGRAVVFTTARKLMRSGKLLRRGDRMVDVSAQSLGSHTGANMLWSYALATRNLGQVLPPSTAHWHVVVRAVAPKSAIARPALTMTLPHAPAGTPHGRSALDRRATPAASTMAPTTAPGGEAA